QECLKLMCRSAERPARAWPPRPAAAPGLRAQGPGLRDEVPPPRPRAPSPGPPPPAPPPPPPLAPPARQPPPTTPTPGAPAARPPRALSPEPWALTSSALTSPPPCPLRAPTPIIHPDDRGAGGRPLAEIIPSEPDPGNAGAGSRTGRACSLRRRVSTIHRRP